MASKTALGRTPTEGPDSAWGALGLELWCRQRDAVAQGEQRAPRQ